MPPLDLTLILAAASSNMGIGRAGTLPWTGLKKEMAYFARVTKRLPPRAPATARNAVIMGRKTWESIPERFRPLAGRLNVVVSSSADGIDVRSAGGEEEKKDEGRKKKKGGKDGVDDDVVVVWAESFEKAVAFLEGKREGKEGKEGGMEEESGKEEVGRVFVIGGGMIYGEAIKYPTDGGRRRKRVLLTRVEDGEEEWGCDTFFEEKLDESEGRWRKVGQEEMDEFVGEEVPRGRQEEGGVGYVFEMWERV